MKTKVKRMSKRTLALLLGVLMLVTSVCVGSVITANSFSGSNTVYFKDTANWGSVYVYFYSRAYDWQYGGVDHGGSKTAQGLASGPNAMTLYSTDGGTNIYSYTYSGNWTHIAFTKDAQSDYEHFYGTSLVPCNNGYKTTTPMCDPTANTSGNQTNSCSVYRNFTWSALPATEYSITKAATSNGSFEVSSESAAEGTEITITPTPDDGYVVDSVKYNDGSDHVLTGPTYSFTMPAKAVTVSVTFKHAGYQLKYEAITSSNGSNWDLGTTLAFTSTGTANEYSATLNVSTTGIYCFVTTQDAAQNKGIYYKHGTDKTSLSVGSSVTLSEKAHQGNYGGIAGKVQFKPSVAGNYIFTFNSSTKVLSVVRETVTYTGVKAAVSPAGAATVSPSSGQSVVSTTGVQVSYSGVDDRYNFSNWTTSQGSFSSTSATTSTTTASPTFYPSGNNATATANFTEKSGTLTISNDSTKGTPSYTNGKTVKAVTTTALPTVTNRQGYTFTGWKVTTGTVYVGNTTYTTSSTGLIAGGTDVNLRANATVTAQYTTNTYTVSYQNVANQHTFDVKVDNSSITSGSNVEYQKTVNVTVNGATGTDYKYLIDSVSGRTLSSVSGKDTTTLTGTFTMPSQDVTLTATSKKAYKVSFTKPSNGTLTVKSGDTTINNGDYVVSGTDLTVTLEAADGYELDTATGVTLTQSSATTSKITYTGTVNVDAAKTFSATTKKITQYTVTLNTTSNITGYTVSYTKNKTAVNNAAYSSAITVDGGTNVTVTATPKGRAAITKWTVNGVDTAGTSASKTFAVNAKTTASATAEKSSDVIYVKPASALLGGVINYHHWGDSVDNNDTMWTGSAVGNNNVYYDANSGVFVISGLTEKENIQFNSDNYNYNTGDQQKVQYGKTYVISTDNNWTSTIKELGDLTDETVIYVNKTTTGISNDGSFTKHIGGAYIFGDCGEVLGAWASNITGNSLPAGITKESATLDGTDYWKITIPNYKFGTDSNIFKIKFKIDDWNPDTTMEHTGLTTGKIYKFDVSMNSDHNGWNVDITDETPDDGGDEYYLAGQYSDGTPYFFGTAWSPSTNQMFLDGSNYEKTFTSNIPAGTVLFKVVKNGNWDDGSWPEENQSYVIRDNAEWVKFSFNPSTHKITVTQKNSGEGSTGEWTAGDKYTLTGSQNSNRKVDDTPNIGSTSTDYKYVWANNDNGPGKITGNTPITVVANGSSGSIGYWADITEQVKAVNGNFYFALSNNGSNGGIRGNKSEQINCLTKSAGESTTMYTSSGAQAFVAGMKYNSNTTGSANFILLKDVKWEKVSNIGVMAYYNNSNVDYQFYFKEKGVEPVKETKVVDIYAKNGTLRDSTFNRFTDLANTTIEDYFSYTDEDGKTYNSISAYNTDNPSKKIVNTHDIAFGNSTYDMITNVPVGAKIKITTELSPKGEKFTGTSKFSDTHYLKGYSFNGMTYKVFEAADGIATTNGKKFTEEWTVRAVNTQYTDSSDNLVNATKDGKAVEVTPIYYMQDSTNCKTFYIDGYDGEVQNAWGNMLAVYPYYEGKSNSANAFGGYPGQPMLFYGGKYQMEIPLTVDGTATGATVKGLTLHNGYWDLLHRDLDIRCNTKNHSQTYDYDDFYKLYKEKNPDSIIFSFKYRTKTDNYGDGYQYEKYDFAGTAAKGASDFVNQNGVELVTDYFGRQVDAFGGLIKDSAVSDWDEDNQTQDKELLFVSTGYKDTYVGEYATIWAVYAPQSSIPSGSGDTAGKFIGYISSSMLYLNNFGRVSQYTDGTSEANGRMSWAQFKNTYEHLKNYYIGVPALISYEKEIWNDSKDKANRSDGKWYYSNNTDKISANIKIQYGAASLLDAPDHSVSSNAWKDDPFSETKTGVNGYKNIGDITACSAYFTNTTPNLKGKVESGEQFADNSKKFTFQAVASGSYMFAGWVRYNNGKYYEITENELGESNMSANDTYIARFVATKTGTLNVSHVVEQTDEFTGTGTPEVTVLIKNGSTEVLNRTVNDGSKIDVSQYISSKFANYTINITLKTTPTSGSESYMKEIVSNSGSYGATPNKWNEGNPANPDTAAKTATVEEFTVGEILDSGVTSLRYVSHLAKPSYTYNYEITYTYTSRFWGEQSYTVTGTMTDGEFAASGTGSKTTAKLTEHFIEEKTPYEKNFRQQINWNYTNNKVGEANAMVNNNATLVSGTTYKLTAHVYSSNTVNDRVKAEFILPYDYDYSANNGFTAKGTDTYNNDGTKLDATELVFDEAIEGKTLEAQAYHLFTFDGSDAQGGEGVVPSGQKLVEAAPYVIKNPDFYKTKISNKRYFTGKSFEVNGINYYLNESDIPGGSVDSTHQLLTNNNTVTVEKPEKKGQSGYSGTTYHYAVQDSTTKDVYFFAYAINGDDQPVDNSGNVMDDPAKYVFNGQYIKYSVVDKTVGIIAKDYTKKYFTRWDIYNTKGEFVASTYSRKFNYSGYDNYVVKAVYESDTEQEYYADNPAGIDATITYLGDTRNQWNNSALGTYKTVTGKTDGDTAGDKLLHDFAIAYSYNGKEIQTIESSEATIKIGMIIEQLGALDTAGGKKITDASYYADQYKTDAATAVNAIKTGLGSNTKPQTGHTIINSKIGANVDNWGTKFGSDVSQASTLMSFDSVVDNMNRLQWFYTFDNNKDASGLRNGNYAYRAWSYIIVNGNATVSSTPAYFTLYDSASR